MNLYLQNQQQHDWRKWFAITVGLLLLAIAHWACSPQKQMDKAYQKVITDSATLAKVRLVVERIWPCVPAIGKPGKTITVTNTVVDTAQIRALQSTLDSIMSKRNITPTMNIDSLKRALSIEILSGIHPVIKHETSLRVDTVPDTRAIELMQERLDAAKQAENNAEGQIIAQTKQIQELTKTADTRLYIIIGIASLIAIILGVGVYLKFFTPTGATTSVWKTFFNK